jgi:hypothetical protein
VPEDRFGDLGLDPADGRSAAERLAELDEKRPEPDMPKPPEPRRGSGRYTWVVGVAAVILIVIVGANTLPKAGEGLKGLPPGMRMPAFAAASATGPFDAPANIRQSLADKRQGKRPACEVTGPGIVNLCQLRTKPLVLAFIVPGPKKCEQQIDTLQGLRASYPGVNFAAVVSGGGRGQVSSLVRKHGWTFPVAHDQPPVLFNLYRVAICPTITFAYRGGVVRRSTIHPLSAQQLRAEIAAIERKGA